MQIKLDPAKDARNIEPRGIFFEEAANFEWDSALILLDTLEDDGDRATGLSASLKTGFRP